MALAVADQQNAEDGAGPEATDSADESDTGDSDNEDEEEIREEGDGEKAEADIAESDEEDIGDDDQDSEDDAYYNISTNVSQTHNDKRHPTPTRRHNNDTLLKSIKNSYIPGAPAVAAGTLQI